MQITPALAVALAPTIAAPAAKDIGEPGCVVRRRDSLWLLAEKHLGDGMRWREIYDLNRGRPQPGGRTLRDPDLILPGWNLRMPTDATGLTQPPPRAENEPVTEPAPTPMPSWPAPNGPAVATPELPAQPQVTAPTTVQSAPTPKAEADATPADDPADDNFPIPKALVGATLLAAGIVLTIDRLRRRQMRYRHPDRTIPFPTGAAKDAERLLRAAAASRPANRLDLALRLLAHQIAQATGAEASRVDAVRVDGDRIEILLTTPADAPPGPFEVTSGHAWTLPADTDSPELDSIASRTTAPAPALVTVGHLDGNPILIDLENQALTLTGNRERAETLVWSLALELATSVWADDLRVIVVGTAPSGLEGLDRIETVNTLDELIPQLVLDEHAAHDALVAAGHTSRWTARLAGVGDAWTPTIVLIAPGTDASLPLPPGVGCVHWEATPSAGSRTLTLGDDHDRLDPIGLDLEHAGISQDLADATAEILTVALSEEPGRELSPTPHALAPLPSGPFGHPIDLRAEPEPFDLAAPDPDRVLVHILGPVRIEGAKYPIRRRRIKELIVYLALHREGVTDEQIMTALWPGDTPTRTAFNQSISRARAALGTSRTGQPIIPYVDNGIYRPSNHLITDLQLLDRHKGTWETGEATLGVPFSGSEGFEWAYVEGHAHQAAALLERSRVPAGANQV